jgi:hypothetical protein
LLLPLSLLPPLFPLLPLLLLLLLLHFHAAFAAV